ncbi:MAG: hypothetical protein M1587_06085 [Thaumarchaeota archaeon]|nr:hypothetical protein [Nitrososphaerota archaeon]
MTEGEQIPRDRKISLHSPQEAAYSTLFEQVLKEGLHTLRQHIAILVMFQRVGKSYREYTDDWLPVSNAIAEALGLKKLPHYTSLEKFAL